MLRRHISVYYAVQPRRHMRQEANAAEAALVATVDGDDDATLAAAPKASAAGIAKAETKAIEKTRAPKGQYSIEYTTVPHHDHLCF